MIRLMKRGRSKKEMELLQTLNARNNLSKYCASVGVGLIQATTCVSIVLGSTNLHYCEERARGMDGGRCDSI